MFSQYGHLACSIAETVKTNVPPKRRPRINGKRVSDRTKGLYLQRTAEFSRKESVTPADRKRWNKTIKQAALDDYRHWVATWVAQIEEADNRGDTKAIYDAVKRISGSTRNSSQTTRNTNPYRQPCKGRIAEGAASWPF